MVPTRTGAGPSAPRALRPSPKEPITIAEAATARTASRTQLTGTIVDPRENAAFRPRCGASPGCGRSRGTSPRPTPDRTSREAARPPGGGPLWDRSMARNVPSTDRSEEHTSELQSPCNLVCRLLLENKKTDRQTPHVLQSASHATPMVVS